MTLSELKDDEPKTLTLDAVDLTSPTWRKLVKHYQGRLQKCHQRNSGPLNIEETSKVRGQIMEIEGLLRLNIVKTDQERHQYRVTER